MSANSPSDATRERILQAADQMFGELGFDAAATRLIAERSGVNKALIHYHFNSKEALFERVLDRYYERLAETMRAAFSPGSAGSPEGGLRDRLARLLDTYLDFLRDNRNFGRIVQREAAGGPHMERIREQMVPLFELGTAAVKAAYPATREGALAAEQLLTSFYGMIISYFTYSGVLERLLGADPLSDASFAARKRHLRRMLEIVLAAVESDAAPEVTG